MKPKLDPKRNAARPKTKRGSASKTKKSTNSTPIKKAAPKIDKTASQKAAFLKLYPKLRCNITATAARVRIDRGTFYDWQKNDEDFAAAAADAFESLIDHVEDKLHKLINSMEPSAVYFFLKTRAKKRGYIEKTEFEGSVNHRDQLSMTDLQKSLKDYGEADK
jgi:hypothetical protein